MNLMDMPTNDHHDPNGESIQEVKNGINYID